MAGKYRDRLTFSNVVSVISLLFALGLGSAWAATELEKNEVKSKHIGKGQVKNVDLANNAVTSPKVADGSLLNQDFAPGQLPAGPQGERGLQGEQGPPGQPGAPGENGTDIATIGRHSFGTSCEDDDENGQICATVSLDMPQAGRVLVSGSHYAYAKQLNDATGPSSGTDSATSVFGQCSLRADGSGLTGGT
jgi:hypothetical protein